MDLSFASNAFKRNTLEEAIDLLAAIGYRGVELMADLHHAHPDALTPQRSRDLRKRLADHGMFVSNVNAFTGFACGTDARPGDTYHPTWLESDLTYRQRRIDHTRRCIEVAAAFDCRTISLQPGGPLIGTPLTREEAGRRFADGIAACLDTARSHDVLLAVEPEPGLFIQTTQEYLDWKAAHLPDEPHLRMNADLGHLFCVGEDPAAVVRAHTTEIAHVHLEDIGANRVHQHLTPGRGVIDFAAIFRALRDTAFPGRVTVELYPYETTAAGVARLAWDHLTPMVSAL